MINSLQSPLPPPIIMVKIKPRRVILAGNGGEGEGIKLCAKCLLGSSAVKLRGNYRRIM